MKEENNKVKETHQELGKKFFIIVKDFHSKEDFYEVYPENTVNQLKAIISLRNNVFSRMNLVFGGKHLSDNLTLKEYNIIKNSVVLMTFKISCSGGILYIKDFNGDTKELSLPSSSTTIHQLKEIIRSQRKSPFESFHLIFAGQKLDDDKTLNDYGINSCCVIYFFPMYIVVRIKNKKYGSIRCYINNKNIKLLNIKQKVFEQLNIPIEQQLFMYKECILADDHYELMDLKEGDQNEMELIEDM